MTKWKDDYHLLGLGGLTSLITNVIVSKWGNEVLIQCLYNPLEKVAYTLAFEDCRDIRWTVHDEEEVGENEAEIYGITLGEGGHRKPAVIHPDIFEISIIYGSFKIQMPPSYSPFTPFGRKGLGDSGIPPSPSHLLG